MFDIKSRDKMPTKTSYHTSSQLKQEQSNYYNVLGLCHTKPHVIQTCTSLPDGLGRQHFGVFLFLTHINIYIKKNPILLK